MCGLCLGVFDILLIDLGTVEEFLSNQSHILGPILVGSV
jgi:hypothetical protein